MNWIRLWLVCGFLSIFAQLTSGQLTANGVPLTLVTSMGATNRMDLTLNAGILGTDTKSSDFSGVFDVNFQLSRSAPNAYVIDQFTISGGSILATDVTFNLLVAVTGTGLGGVPSTVVAPSEVTSGTFSASDHVFTLNQGTISAAGTSLDFATMPVTAPGSGTGFLAITQQTPLPGMDILEVMITLPVEVDETFDVENVPIFGTVPTRLTGTMDLIATGSILIPIAPGDYDRSGTLDCQDIDLLGAAIRTGSADLLFDANGDGMVDFADYESWVVDLKGTVLGDANLNFVNDVSDFNVWSQAKFTSGTGWCQGDFDGNGATDVSDFNIWNGNRFTSAPVAVPEPNGLVWPLLGLLRCFARRAVPASAISASTPSNLREF